MANGDLAASIGIETVSGSDDRRQGYDEINRALDLIAQHLLTGTHGAHQITSGVFAPARLGFRVHVANLSGIEFDANGAADAEHGAPFTPVGIWPQIRLNTESVAVDVFPRATLPSWNATEVFLRAKIMSTGLPYQSTVSRLDLFCFGVA